MLTTARLFSRDDGTTSLIGFNLSNSANNETIRKASRIRKALGLEEVVRFEHHITETYKVEIEQDLDHPSDILDYFMAKSDVESQGLMPALEQNYIEKHRSTNLTADALTKAGIAVVCATELHSAA
jgi:hypothetical protein